MKTNKLLIVITLAAILGLPAIAAAHSHFSIGIGIPLYGYGYWGGPYYHCYYPYYSPVVYAPPYYPPVVPGPVIVNRPVAVSQEALTTYVNIPNSNGSITPVRIRRIGTVYVGPKGEQYFSYPTVEQLRPVYGF